MYNRNKHFLSLYEIIHQFNDFDKIHCAVGVVVWAQEVYKFHLDENQVDGNDGREQNGSGLASLPNLHSSFIIKFNKIIKLD